MRRRSLMMWSATGGGGGLRGTLVDVPVIMLDKFQQSWFPLWKSLQSCSSCSSSPCRVCSVPRFSSSTECWTFQLVTSLAVRSAHSAWDRGVPQVQFLGVVLSARCCATTGAVADSTRVCLVRQWIHFLRLYLVRYGRFFAYFLREGGTPILKSTLRPALHLRTGEVCTVGASIAKQLHLEIRTVFSCEPLVFGRLVQLSADSAS